MVLIAASARPAWAVAHFDEIKRSFQPSDTLILSREGQVLQRLRTDLRVRRGQWVALQDISPALRSALVLSEDKRFYEHSGVDWQAASAAAWANLWNQRTRGASTITMQLAGLLDGTDTDTGSETAKLLDLRQRPGGRGVVQKVGQTVVAQVLDRRWSKAQILEAYLNLVPFRGELVGIDALSRTLFGKAAHGLDAREAAVAAALVRAPNARPALVAQRACGVWREMAAAGSTAAQPDCDALDLFTTGALQRRSYAASDGVAPHFARRVLAQAQAQAQANKTPAALRLTSTLRAPLQRFAVQTLAQQLRELRGAHVEDGAIVVLDNASGQVLAWVGSSGTLSQAAQVDAVLAQRQPGSTLKPFLYAQALAERRLTAASLIDDSPAHLPTSSGLYIPQNYDRQFKGWVSVRTALAASLNVPAVRALVMVSPDAFFRQLQAVGLPLRESGGYFGYSLALGSSEVQLLHLTNAFRTLANGGRFSPVAPALLTPAAKPTFSRALDAGAAFIVGDILSDPNARARTFGTDSVLATRFWTAVKTGTSKDMRDNWAVGWSQRYSVGVWVGNASGAAMHDVSGSSGAAPIWATVMAYLHAQEPSRAPAPPRGVVSVPVQFGAAPGTAFALEAARPEWFLPGTQQTLFAIENRATSAGIQRARGLKGSKSVPETVDLSAVRIAQPVSGAVVALDPDVPPAHQRVQLAASSVPAGARLRWRLNGQPLAEG
ncbi:MAG: penicillin-binding protein 1C, partial [Giesbergeria sp.]|nr:penicillin-binding protein 1C [Giesbergeria sp.]